MKPNSLNKKMKINILMRFVMAKVKALGETLVSETFVKILSHMFRSSYQKHS